MKSKINFNLDLLNDKNFVYALGILWADGNVYYNEQIYKKQISINMVSDDINSIKNIFLNFADWYIYDFIPKGHSRNKQSRLGLTSKELCEFLINNDYCDKSFKSPDKILSLIPDNLKHYWWRGLVDGDGCFYFNQKYKTSKHAFSVTSGYEQDWNYLIELCNKLNIKFHITKFIHNKGKGSAFRIGSTKNM